MQDDEFIKISASVPDDRAVGITSPYLHFDPNITGQIKILSDYSTGIGSVFASNDSLFGGYSAVLDSQRVTMESLAHLGGVTSEIPYAFADTALPLSSTIAQIGYAGASAFNLLDTGYIDQNQFKISQDFSSLMLNTVQDQQFIFNSAIGLANHVEMPNYLTDYMSSIQLVSSGVSEMVRSYPTYPSLLRDEVLPDLVAPVNVIEVTSEDVSQYQSRLDEMLSSIDPELVEFRKAVWDTFNAKGRDYVGQSSSSMRRLVDNLLREIAPQKKVEETEFFKNSPLAKDKNSRPTRKARVYYVVDWDQNKAEHLERMVTGFLAAYDNLSAWDHTPLNEDGFVHGAFIAIEGQLISLLSARIN